MAEERGLDSGYEDIDQPPFQPSVHDGIPVELPGARRSVPYGGLKKWAHPPLECVQPRYSATLRGFYRCPACGEKMPLAGDVNWGEAGREIGERFAESLAGGVVQAFWLTVGIAEDIVYAARWVWWQLTSRRAARQNGRGEATEMSRALLIMAMVAARNRDRERA